MPAESAEDEGRSQDLARLAARFAAADPRATLADEAAAVELRRLREALAASFASATAVETCSRCASGHPWPNGRWDGGHCCGTRTELVFTDDEIAALALSGTTTGDLVPPSGPHAGCAFRGPEGCSLGAAHRPNICVRFVCRELEEELAARGELAPIKAAASALGRAFERWRRTLAARVPERMPWDDG